MPKGVHLVVVEAINEYSWLALHAYERMREAGR